MGKRQKKEGLPSKEASPPVEHPTATALSEPPPSEPPPNDPVGVAAPKGFDPLPLIGDIVWTIDRARMNSAEASGRTPDPIGALVTRIYRNKLNETTGSVAVMLLDPELGPLPKRDLPFSPTLKADHWTPRPVRARVPFADLKKACELVIREYLGTGPESLSSLPPLV
jgi:hypothetical protein